MSLAHPDCTAIPTTSTPRDEYSFSSLLNSGISLTQLSHQVAQKSRTTILSLRSSERSVRPSSCGSETCGTESGCWPATLTNSKQMKINVLIFAVHQLCEAALKRFAVLFTSPRQHIPDGFRASQAHNPSRIS